MDLTTLILAKKYANSQRLGYIENADTILLDNVPLTLDSNEPDITFYKVEKVSPLSLKAGNKYKVTLDSGVYESTCVSYAYDEYIVYIIGNSKSLNGIDTGESFSIFELRYSGTVCSYLVIDYNRGTSVTVAEVGTKEVVHQIDNKYLSFFDRKEIEILPKTTLVTSDEIEGATQYFAEGKAFELLEGKTYWVHLDSGIFECKAKTVDGTNPGSLMLGNEHILDEENEDTGECFIIGVVDTTGDGQFMTIVMDTNASSSVSITIKQDVIKPEHLPILEKYDREVLPWTDMSEEDDATTCYVTGYSKNPLEVGKSYTVMLDSGNYDCVCKEISINGDSITILGNVSIASADFHDTGENFVVMSFPPDIEGSSYTVVIVDTAKSSKGCITMKDDVIKQQYLPLYGGIPVVELTTRLPMDQSSTSTELTDDEKVALDEAVSQSQHLILSATTTLEGTDVFTISGLATRCKEASGAIAYVVSMNTSYAVISIAVSQSSNKVWSGVANVFGSID